MPWTSHEVRPDKDDPNYAVVIVKWQPQGGGQEFRHRERIRMTDQAKEAFIVRAIAARDAGAQKQVEAKARFEDIQGRLNQADAGPPE